MSSPQPHQPKKIPDGAGSESDLPHQGLHWEGTAFPQDQLPGANRWLVY